MDDVFDFLADPSDAAKGRRLAAALRRERGQADLLQATGDKQLGGLAQQQYRVADEGEQAMRQATSGYLTRAAEAERQRAALAEKDKLATNASPLQAAKMAAAQARIDAENERTRMMLTKAGRGAKGGGAPALGPDGKPLPAPKSLGQLKYELAKQRFDTALGPLEGYEAVDPARPAFPDQSVADKTRAAQAADSQLDTHAKDALEGYDEYLRAPVGSDQWVKSKNKVTNSLVNMTSKLVLAEGKPLTEGSEQAIAATLGLRKDEKGGWSFIGPESMWTKDAVADRVKNAAASGHANFGILIGTTNQRKRAAQAAGVPTSAPAPAAAPPGKVHVSNGKEAFWIDAADLPAAQKDGFQVMK